MKDLFKAAQTAVAQQYADTGRLVDENPFSANETMPSDDQFAASAMTNAVEIFSSVMSADDRTRLKGQLEETLRDVADVMGVELGDFELSDNELNDVLLTAMVDRTND